MSTYTSVTKLIAAVEYTDTRLGNSFKAVAVEATELGIEPVLRDLLSAYQNPMLQAKEQGNKKLQTAIGRRWNVARTGVTHAMKAAGHTVKFPDIRKGGDISILDNPAAAKLAVEKKEKQAADDSAAMAELTTSNEQRRLDGIKSLTLDKLCDEIEATMAASDHSPETVLAELISRHAKISPDPQIWATAA